MSYQGTSVHVIGPYYSGGVKTFGPHYDYVGPMNCGGGCSKDCWVESSLSALKWVTVCITPFVPIFVGSGNGSMAKDRTCYINTAVTVAFVICGLLSTVYCAVAFKGCCYPKEQDTRPCCSSRASYPIAGVLGVIILAVEILWYTSCKYPSS